MLFVMSIERGPPLHFKCHFLAPKWAPTRADRPAGGRAGHLPLPAGSPLVKLPNGRPSRLAGHDKMGAPFGQSSPDRDEQPSVAAVAAAEHR